MDKGRALITYPLAAVLSIGLLVTGGGRAAAAPTTRWVNNADLTPTPPGTSCADAGYLTITLAIAASSAGDVIMVCPGTYLEQVQINKTLTLRGARWGVDARTRSVTPTSESIIDDPCGPVQILADNVVLDGFTVQGSTMLDPCFIAGIWLNPGGFGGGNGPQILNNIVQNNVSGIELSSSSCTLPALVQFNLIQNNNNPGPLSGTGIESDFDLCNAKIDRNKFSGHTNASVFFESTLQQNVAISNNELVGGSSERIFLANTTNSQIAGNVSFGSTSSGTIRLYSGNSNLTINGNTLVNGMRGIRIDDLDPVNPAGNSNVLAHLNCIQGNSIAGLEIAAGDYTGTLHAENNWWGSRRGPTIASNPGGNGDKIVDPNNQVIYRPWLRTSPCAPPPPPVCKPDQEDKGNGDVDQNDEKGHQHGHFDFDECDDGHQVSHQDSDRNVDFHSDPGAHDSPTFDALLPIATTVGQGMNNGKPVAYTLVVTDLGIGPGTDIYSLTLSDSTGIIYAMTGKLTSGNISVHR